jgi:hypothetical protein
LSGIGNEVLSRNEELLADIREMLPEYDGTDGVSGASLVAALLAMEERAGSPVRTVAHVIVTLKLAASCTHSCAPVV